MLILFNEGVFESGLIYLQVKIAINFGNFDQVNNGSSE